jgi:hypothetical protein
MGVARLRMPKKIPIPMIASNTRPNEKVVLSLYGRAGIHSSFFGFGGGNLNVCFAVGVITTGLESLRTC